MTRNGGYLIGVDGGGSNCRMAIADAGGRVLARIAGPSANVTTSLGRGIAVLPETLERARAHIGLAGVKSDAIARAVAAGFPARDVAVTEDRPTVVAGAPGTRDGYVAAIGTGSFPGRRRRAGQSFIGGWGLMLGDQASGAWLGRKLLAALAEWRDGLRPGSDVLERTFAGFEGDDGAVTALAAGAGLTGSPKAPRRCSTPPRRRIPPPPKSSPRGPPTSRRPSMRWVVARASCCA